MKRTQEELQAIVFPQEASKAIQKLLDAEARKAGYDNIISACSYVGSTNFGAEAQSFLDWRDAIWTYAYQVQTDVKSGSRELPTIDELLAELPIRV